MENNESLTLVRSYESFMKSYIVSCEFCCEILYESEFLHESLNSCMSLL